MELEKGDLQKLLRNTMGDELVVVNCTMSPLVPLGENYNSSLLKVDIELKRTKDSPKENLHLVAKMISTSVIKTVKMDVSFKKEIFVFDKLATAYKEMEKKFMPEYKNLIDLFPKFYGGRCTVKEDSSEQAILLLENLKVSGYDTMDRKKGLDLDHAKVAITELARFHALGMALKHHEPALFEEAKSLMQEVPFDMESMDQQTVMGHLFRTIFQDPRIAKYQNRILSAMPRTRFDAVEVKAVEPWVTIVHGDFWVNNIMFRQDEEHERVREVKFIDFQIARITSPMKDLPYFLCGNTSTEVLHNHIDELLDLYYDRFIEMLGKLDCDNSPFTKENFEDELSEVARRELFFCLVTLKFFTIEMSPDIQDTKDIVNSILMSDGSRLFLDRVWNLISKYVEKGWI